MLAAGGLPPSLPANAWLAAQEVVYRLCWVQSKASGNSAASAWQSMHNLSVLPFLACQDQHLWLTSKFFGCHPSIHLRAFCNIELLMPLLSTSDQNAIWAINQDSFSCAAWHCVFSCPCCLSFGNQSLDSTTCLERFQNLVLAPVIPLLNVAWLVKIRIYFFLGPNLFLFSGSKLA